MDGCIFIRFVLSEYLYDKDYEVYILKYLQMKHQFERYMYLY